MKLKTMIDLKKETRFAPFRPYRADFLWPFAEGSINEAGYEFANANTKEYQEQWWGILKERILEANKPS